MFKIRTLMLTAFGVALFAAALSARPSAAATACPDGVSACLFVNSNADTDNRDDVLTLREALLVNAGFLPLANLTPGERGQILTPPGWGPGETRIYFDPTVFCANCLTHTISLSPVAGGDPAASPHQIVTVSAIGYSGDKHITMPPGWGPTTPPGWGPTMPPGWGPTMPPGWGPTGAPNVTIGGAYLPGVGEVAATVVLDGSRLGAGDTGLWTGTGGNTLRGLRFQNFAGHAIEIEADAYLNTQLDGVSFAGNGTDVAVLGIVTQ
jgi:hypothetical protein